VGNIKAYVNDDSEWTIEWFIKFLLIILKEFAQEVNPNPDGGTVCVVIYNKVQEQKLRTEVGR
jgi:hypothetical protein